MIEALKEASAYDKRSIRDNLKLVDQIFIWMGSLTLSDKAALYDWWSAEWITWLSIAINAGLGLWVVQTGGKPWSKQRSHTYRRLIFNYHEYALVRSRWHIFSRHLL